MRGGVLKELFNLATVSKIKSDAYFMLCLRLQFGYNLASQAASSDTHLPNIMFLCIETESNLIRGKAFPQILIVAVMGSF